MDRYRIIHICHLQQVLGASILLHLDGLSAPLLCSGILRIFSIRWHLEIPTLENQFTYVIFILPVHKRMRESENLQLILLSCIYFWPDLRRDHYLMLWILTGNKDHLRRTIIPSSALKPSQIWNQIMQLRALSRGILNPQRYMAASLNNLFHCLTVPLVKEFFPIFSLNPSCSSYAPCILKTRVFI